MNSKEQVVIIVGAGPSGIATSACLNRFSIPNLVFEREDCLASLWVKKSYDSLRLNLSAQFSKLPHMPFPQHYPKYASKEQFIQYLENYASHFKVNPLYNREVKLAAFNEAIGKWCVTVKVKKTSGSDFGHGEEEYVSRFLVVATGETSVPNIPRDELELGSFAGKYLHSTQYKSGEEFSDKSVLVVGSGNSGMEIALDLANYGAKTSMVVRSPRHIINRKMEDMGLILVKYLLPLGIVDWLLVFLSKWVFGDTSKYGIPRPEKGPFFMQWKYGKYPTIDVGTFDKIKSGKIQVLPEITSITGKRIGFANAQSYEFDVIVLATGFKRTTHKWLKDNDDLLNKDGIAKRSFPDNWKGPNGLYCTGLSRRGPYGASIDAKKIAADIKRLY